MKKIVTLLCTACMLINSTSIICMAAEEPIPKISEQIPEKTAGLITEKRLSISKQGSVLYIYGITKSDLTMKTIGFNSIVIEYSSDASNWYNYDTLSNIYNHDTSVCEINGLSQNVVNGYYYRVRLNHYAKEYGLFGNSQTEPNVSNVVS